MLHREEIRSVLLSCEHAKNSYPSEMESIFKGRQKLLCSHRGWDEGALDIARALKRRLDATLIEGRHSRLVIDLNRSIHHRSVFSTLTRLLPRAEKEKILQAIYHPFREEAATFVRNHSHTLHISVHSFTPVLEGKIRNCEIGILYDPSRPAEKEIALQLKKHFAFSFPDFRVRMNYPYRGRYDGHTSALRRVFSASRYAGIELEFNQGMLRRLKRKSKMINRVADGIELVLRRSVGR